MRLSARFFFIGKAKNLFILGLVFLFLAGMAIATDHQGFAGRLLILPFYLFLLGAVKYLWEIKGS